VVLTNGQMAKKVKSDPRVPPIVVSTVSTVKNKSHRKGVNGAKVEVQQVPENVQSHSQMFFKPNQS